jgi:sarcosine oxidase
MKTCDVAIVGAGVMGAAAACELAREGASVALIDQSLMPNPRAASIDHSKVFRFAYPDPFYVKLAVDALKRWREIESASGARLITQTGALLLGNHEPSFESECFDAMRSLELETDKLDSTQLSARFPQFNSGAVDYTVYDPSGAILHAETAVRALIQLARKRRVEIVEGQRVIDVKQAGSSLSALTESGREIRCNGALIASGPWSRKLVPFLERSLTTTRQEIVYFEPKPSDLSFEPSKFPIFLELGSGFYGFPIHHAGAMKIANHHKGVEVDPNAAEDQVGEVFVQRCRNFFSQFIPGLADARVRETRTCIYNNTPDDDFIIDWHPELDRVLIITGFSGHGFKFGPTIGRIGAELLMTGRAPFNIDRFRLTRFNNN